MKNIIILTSTITTCLLGIDLEVLKMKDEGKDIYHLILSSEKDFICKKTTDYNLEDKIFCQIESENNISQSKHFELFDLSINNNEITIIPKKNYKIFYDDEEIYNKKLFEDKKRYKKIDIIFYDNIPTVLNYEVAKENLNFDINYIKSNYSYIDVLNDNLTPIDSLRDVTKIDFIKKLYKKGDFIGVVKKADRELEKGNIYSSEILLFKIRALDKILDDKRENGYNFEDIETACDFFIDNYPSNKDLTEVYYYKIKSLFKRGKYKKAIILTNEITKNFKDDYFTQKARILKAKSLFSRRNTKYKSYKILKDVLFNTKYVDNALESAFTLVNNYLNDSDAKSAKVYLEKIIKYNKDYLLDKYDQAYNIAKKFAGLKDFKTAYKIGSILEKKQITEELLKNIAVWAEKANMSEIAYKYYKKYLKQYPDGKFSDFVKEKLDKVLINIKDENVTKKIYDIDQVLQKYSNEPIYKKALIKKVKLLMEEQRYKDVLNLSKKLEDINATKYVRESAQKILYSYLSKNDCINAVNIVDKYGVSVNNEKLYELAKCYYDVARYKESLELARKFIRSENFDEETKWYFIAIKSAFKQKNWTMAIKLYEDLKQLAKPYEIDKNIYVALFYSYFNLKYIDKSLGILSYLEKNDPKNPKLLDIYYKLVKYYKDKGIDLSVVIYAKKLLKLQKELKIEVYSPVVDIMLIKSLESLNRYKEALKYFADAYLSKNINDSQKAQLLYLAGEISLKNKKIEQAKEFFIKCGTDVKSQMWQKLCSENLKMLEDK